MNCAFVLVLSFIPANGRVLSAQVSYSYLNAALNIKAVGQTVLACGA
jgi:hypothetical protein